MARRAPFLSDTALPTAGLQADLVRRARAASLKPGEARRASGAGTGPSRSDRGGAASRPGPDAAGARGANDGTPKERELVERCALQPARPVLWLRCADARRLRSSILRTKDYYELLGVPRTASDGDIKKACVLAGLLQCASPLRATVILQVSKTRAHAAP